MAGVVFQPLAFLRTPERVTREILALFAAAGIPVVLVDHNTDVGDGRQKYDFVGIDNLEAGRSLGAQLLTQGAKRIHDGTPPFISRRRSPPYAGRGRA